MKSVQSGNLQTSISGMSQIPISTVDASKSLLWLFDTGYRSQGMTTSGLSTQYRLYDDRIDIAASSSGSTHIYISWQVVEFY